MYRRQPEAEPHGEQARLLLVEDDRELAGMLDGLLTSEDYAVELAYDGQRGLHLGLTRRHDVLVIDRLLPAIDGLDLLRRLRSQAVTTPVLMLTALGELEHRVAGLDAGADDYLTKPFEIDELTARIRALRRRHLDEASVVPLGAGRLLLEAHQVSLPDGALVALSTREFALLRLLATQPKAIHSRDRLRHNVFEDAPAGSIVDTYVYYLRRKLGQDVVKTVRGVGYQVGAL